MVDYKSQKCFYKKRALGELSNQLDITETSPYKSDPRFPPKHIVKMGEIWGRNQNDKNG